MSSGVVGARPDSRRASAPPSTPTRTVVASRGIQSASARAIAVRSRASRASAPKSNAVDRSPNDTLARIWSGACAAIVLPESTTRRVSPVAWNGALSPPAFTTRDDASCSTSATARSVVPARGSATSPPTASTDHGAVANSPCRSCMRSITPAFDARAVPHAPTRVPNAATGPRAVAAPCAVLSPSRARRSRGRASVSRSSTPDSALPKRAENPPVEKRTARRFCGSSAPNIPPESPSNRDAAIMRPPSTYTGVSDGAPPRVYTSLPSVTRVAPGCSVTF